MLVFSQELRQAIDMDNGPLDPTNIDFIALCRRHPMFVPIVAHGQIAPVRDVDLPMHPPVMPMDVKDYVLGLSALGYRFDLIDQHSRLRVQPPSSPIPATWEGRAEDIRGVFGAGREAEVVVYLKGRMVYD